MLRLTKTFVENRWFRRISPGQYQEIPKGETKEGPALDAQIEAWVRETGNIIIHPGQLGMHTSWYGEGDDPHQLRCVSLGLTVLYQEAKDAGARTGPIAHADPTHTDPGAATQGPGTVPARRWGGPASAADGA